ncbi:pitrilysin family protein [Metallibacterium sp.]|uniref:M16 family metallopeptidase n=1 Tax=Metallibacterium sp. TaxID=2940281 RepID=UPI002616DDAC|nr:pitrilysin family protein [Metallibacterium sp.]
MQTLSRWMSAAWLLLLPLVAAAASSGVVRATLDNGLRVVIVRNALAPVVTTQVSYLAGSDEAPASFPGTAHALEHMMFRGSPGLTRDQLAVIGAGMGGDFNAFTTQAVTSYYFTAPAQDLDVALHIEALRMRGLDLSPAGWARERGAIEQEVARDRSDPFYVFNTQLLAAMFKGTPYAHDALGTRPSFNRTGAPLLKKFYDTWYAPNNAILVVAGDVDPQTTLGEIETLFGAIPRKTLPARPRYDFQPVAAATLHYPTDYPVGVAVLAYRMPGLQASDYAAADILVRVLGSQRGALYALVPQGKALFASFQSQFLPRAGIGYAVGAFAKGGDAEALLAQMRAILARYAADGVPADLVDAAKRKAIAQLAFQKNSITGLANAWTNALAFQGLDSPEDMAAAYAAVTPAAVDRLARGVLQPAHVITAILTPEPSGKPIAGKGFGGAESFAAAPEKPVALPAWASAALDRLELPKSTLQPYSTTLRNGLRLIVQPENISDTITVLGSVRTQPDLQQPKGQDGVGEVLSGLFNFGTTTLGRLAFRKALDDIAASESAGYSFAIAAPSAHFARALQLLADNELHPALPEAAFRIVRQQTAQALAGQMDTPDYLFARAIKHALLPARDPALREATPASVLKLSYRDVKNYYAQTFRPDLTTIVVIGKVTPARAQHVIAAQFGGWQAPSARPDLDLPAVPPNQPAQQVVPDKTSVQDTVALVQNTPLTLRDPARYALTVGNQVLGQGGFASRLWRDLRVKTGLVYGVSSSFDIGRTRSTYRVTLGCDADKVGQARAIVVRDIEQMQRQPISALELKRAQGMLIRRIPLGESSINAIGGALLYYAQHDLPLDQARIAVRQYLQVTAPEIRTAFAKYIRPKDFVEVVKGPAPRRGGIEAGNR